MPSAPSTLSYHSVGRCASPALPPAPGAMAGMPRAIGTFASVDALTSSASRPSARLAATAAWTSGWARGVMPGGRSPRSRGSTRRGGERGRGRGVGPGAGRGGAGRAAAVLVVGGAIDRGVHGDVELRQGAGILAAEVQVEPRLLGDRVEAGAAAA